LGRLFVLKSAGFVDGIGFILYEIFGNYSIKTLFIVMTCFGFSATFNVIFKYSPEIFPTSIRSTVMGFLYLISRKRALIVPTVTITISYTQILFGILSIVTSYLCFQLTEPLRRDIDEDMPKVNRQKSFLSSLNVSFRKSRKISGKYFNKMSFTKPIVSDFKLKLRNRFLYFCFKDMYILIS